MVEGFPKQNVRSKAEEKVGKVQVAFLAVSCIRDNRIQPTTIYRITNIPKLKWQIT